MLCHNPLVATTGSRLAYLSTEQSLMAEANSEDPLSNRTHPNSNTGLKVNWAAIAAILIGIGIVIQVLVYLQGRAAPKLRAEAIHFSGERRDLSEAREEIIEEFFETLSQLSSDNPGMSYVERLDMALP